MFRQTYLMPRELAEPGAIQLGMTAAQLRVSTTQIGRCIKFAYIREHMRLIPDDAPHTS